MSLTDFLTNLDGLLSEAQSAFGEAADADALETARVEYLGAKSGRLRKAQKGLGKVDKADKPAAGKRFNEVKQVLESLFEQATEKLTGGDASSGDAKHFDPTIPGNRLRLGHIHPITQTIRELTDIMGRLGFTSAEGPEIEDEHHNFEALNIPRIHPARDPLENFYLSVAGRRKR